MNPQPAHPQHIASSAQALPVTALQFLSEIQNANRRGQTELHDLCFLVKVREADEQII